MLFEINLNNEDLIIFWNKVDIGEINECWNWAWGTDGKGYGQCYINSKKYIASRVSYFIKNGSFEKKLKVCHSCDNPKCVNPNHLWLGTSLDNTRDMINKNRAYYVEGEDIGSSKLKTEDVIKIRELYDQNKNTQKELSIIYNVTEPTIRCVIKGFTWKNAGGPISNKSNRKVTKDDVIVIRTMAGEGIEYKKLSEIFNISYKEIYRIVKRKRWENVD
jgi:hypothetical protein